MIALTGDTSADPPAWAGKPLAPRTLQRSGCGGRLGVHAAHALLVVGDERQAGGGRRPCHGTIRGQRSRSVDGRSRRLHKQAQPGVSRAQQQLQVSVAAQAELGHSRHAAPAPHRVQRCERLGATRWRHGQCNQRPWLRAEDERRAAGFSRCKLSGLPHQPPGWRRRAGVSLLRGVEQPGLEAGNLQGCRAAEHHTRSVLVCCRCCTSCAGDL